MNNAYERRLRLLLLPYALGIGLLVIVPAAMSFALAFFRYDALGPPRFAGWLNFTLARTDALFTLNLLASGAQEINVVMNALITHDVRTFLAVKIGSTGLSAVLLAVVARRQFLGIFPVVRLLQLFCAGYVFLLVYEVWMFVTYF